MNRFRDADPAGWKLVRATRARLKGEGSGYAFGVPNGMPTLKQVVGLGSLLPAGNTQGFIRDGMRVLEPQETNIPICV